VRLSHRSDVKHQSGCSNNTFSLGWRRMTWGKRVRRVSVAECTAAPSGRGCERRLSGEQSAASSRSSGPRLDERLDGLGALNLPIKFEMPIFRRALPAVLAKFQLPARDRELVLH